VNTRENPSTPAPLDFDGPDASVAYSRKLATITGVQHVHDGTINWNFTLKEKMLALAIVARASDMLAEGRGIAMADDMRQQCEMDILCVHLNGCLLDLERFARTSNEADFVHDFVGIGLNINRRDGRLCNGFKPVFAMKVI
jgi:hypothetical protein